VRTLSAVLERSGLILRSIKIKFSISDMGEFAPEEDEFDPTDEDGALSDEDFDTGKKTINQSGVRGGQIDTMPEDSVAPADRGEDGEDVQGSPAYPTHLTITITKPGKKAINIQAMATDGVINIQSLTLFPKASLLDPQSTKEATETQSTYVGPPVEELDPELQEMLHQYLEERGIDEELVTLIPEYMDYKEQKEYVNWLHGQ
jgi:complement component 1 Q subcomponent-binding protein, mitochondrial